MQALGAILLTAAHVWRRASPKNCVILWGWLSFFLVVFLAFSQKGGYHSPRNFYKLIPLEVFFCNFFCNFYGNSLRPPIFSVTLMRSSGSRVDWKIFFVIFTKLFPRKIFFCIAKILVLMVQAIWLSETSAKRRSEAAFFTFVRQLLGCCCLFTHHVGRCPSTVLCVWLSDALSSTRVTKPYSEPIQTVLNGAHSEGHPDTEGTFTGTLVNVGDLRRNSGECQGGTRGYTVAGSPKFAKVRQTSPKFA